MKNITLIALLAIAPLAAGCTTSGRNTGAGVLLGSALGAGAGAIIGNQTGNAVDGAFIGAGLGGLTGGLIGNGLDRAEQEAAIGDAQVEAALHEVQVSRGRLSILDVIRMSQAGVGDGLIIAKIDQSGSSFDLSASDIIDLKRSSVSDAVIQKMLQRSAPSYAATAPAPGYRVVERTSYRYPRPTRVYAGRGYHYWD